LPYCRRCGTKLDEDAHFCHRCGTPVATTFAANVPPAAPSPPPQVESSRRDPALVIVAVLIAVVVVVVIIIAVFAILYPINFSTSQNNGNLNQISQILPWGILHAHGLTQNVFDENVIVSLLRT
jgi:uncharacterized membrane protein YvbJ